MTVDPTKLTHNNYVDENGVLWKKCRCFNCSLNCGVYIGSVDGKAVEIAPNVEDGTVLCERFGEGGERMLRWHDHPTRINHAMKRVGERGEDKWEEIPYDQAIQEIADKLNELKAEYGPETLGVCEGTYRSDVFWSRARFNAIFGNPGNLIDAGNVCGTWTTTQYEILYGWPVVSWPYPDPKRGVFMNPGGTIMERYSPRNMGDYWQKWFDKPNHGRLISIDPVCTGMVRNSDLWLAPRPGTDTALILGIVNYIYQQGWHNVDFLTRWSNGPFLIRQDTGKLMREPDINVDGEAGNFVGWDKAAGKPVVWISENRCWTDEQADIALEGEFEVTLADGTTVACKTAFQVIVNNLSPYTLLNVAQITGVPVKKIIDCARMFAKEGPSYRDWSLGGSGDQHGYNALSGLQATSYLQCFTGNLDNEGGQYVGKMGPHINGTVPVRDSEMELNELITPETRAKFLGNDEFPLTSWRVFDALNPWFTKYQGYPKQIAHDLLVQPRMMWDAIETGKPYPVRAMIVWAGNPMLWAPDTNRVMRALQKLDLLVVVEYFKTPTAALADYIMPAADWLERPMFTTVEDMSDRVQVGDQGVPPLYDRHGDFDFWRKLSLATGADPKYWPWETVQDAIAYRVERCGITYDELMEASRIEDGKVFNKQEQIREDGHLRGFNTASGRIELYSSVYESLGVRTLPTYREPPESPFSTPELAKEYPLVLTSGGRYMPFYHSEWRNPGIGTREMRPWPKFDINIETARQLGIREGDWCWIETPRGRIRMRARCGNAIGVNTICCEASWWYPEQPMSFPQLGGALESNVNVLTSSDLDQADPNTGNWVNRGLLCKVYPCEEAPEWFVNSPFNQPAPESC